MERLNRQISYIMELEKLKVIYRQNGTIGGKRAENSAEHSWHLIQMALLLEDSAVFEQLDMMKVVKMLMIHDIVEIDAGDAFLFDNEARAMARGTELSAAKRIFGLLPEDQAKMYQDIWLEFEQDQSNEARYAKAIDALQPIINHSITGQHNLHGLSRSQVIEKKIFIKDISEALWQVALEAIEVCVAKELFYDK